MSELGSSAGGSEDAHHGVVGLSERGLAVAISSNADTIPADVPSSSCLCCIIGFARPVPVAVLVLSSHNTDEGYPKCGASYVIGSQPTASPDVGRAAEAEGAGLADDDRFGGTGAARLLARHDSE